MFALFISLAITSFLHFSCRGITFTQCATKCPGINCYHKHQSSSLLFFTFITHSQHLASYKQLLKIYTRNFRSFDFAPGTCQKSVELAVPKFSRELGLVSNFSKIMLRLVISVICTSMTDAFKANRYQAMNLGIWFKIHTNVSNFYTASPKIINS